MLLSEIQAIHDPNTDPRVILRGMGRKRLADAKSLGFDTSTVWFHGTKGRINGDKLYTPTPSKVTADWLFGPGVYFAKDPQVSSKYSSSGRVYAFLMRRFSKREVFVTYQPQSLSGSQWKILESKFGKKRVDTVKQYRTKSGTDLMGRRMPGQWASPGYGGALFHWMMYGLFDYKLENHNRMAPASQTNMTKLNKVLVDDLGFKMIKHNGTRDGRVNIVLSTKGFITDAKLVTAKFSRDDGSLSG